MDKHDDSHAEDEVESFIEEEDDERRSASALDKRDIFRGKDKDSLERERTEPVHQGFTGEGRFGHRER